MADTCTTISVSAVSSPDVSVDVENADMAVRMTESVSATCNVEQAPYTSIVPNGPTVSIAMDPVNAKVEHNCSVTGAPDNQDNTHILGYELIPEESNQYASNADFVATVQRILDEGKLYQSTPAFESRSITIPGSGIVFALVRQDYEGQGVDCVQYVDGLGVTQSFVDGKAQCSYAEFEYLGEKYYGFAIRKIVPETVTFTTK